MSHSWQVVWFKYEVNWSFGQGVGWSAANLHLWPASIKCLVILKWDYINIILWTYGRQNIFVTSKKCCQKISLRSKFCHQYSILPPTPSHQHWCTQKWRNSPGQSLQVYFVVISNFVPANVIFSAPLTVSADTYWPRGQGYGSRPGVQTWPFGHEKQPSEFEAPKVQVVIGLSEQSKPGGQSLRHDQS